MTLQNTDEGINHSSTSTASFDGNSSWVMSNLEARNELSAYKEALDQNTIVSATDRSGTINYANEQFCKISGYSEAELIGANIRIINSSHHDREFFDDLWRTISRGQPWRGEIRNRGKHGDFYWVDTTIVPRRNVFGKIIGYVSIRYDITARKEIEQELQKEVEKRRNTAELLRELLETIPDGVVAFDSQDKLIHFNTAYKTYHTAKADHLVEGTSFSELLKIAVDNDQYMDLPDSQKAREAYIENRIKRHSSPGRPLIQQLKDGRWLQVQERRSNAGYTVGICTDITDIKQAEKTIKVQAEQDSLTGLANRSVLCDLLTKALSDRKGGELSGALVLIDLDHFKDVNDTLGHDAGDKLLIEIAGRLREVLRKSDTIARIGGDEFAVMLPNITTAADVDRVLKKLLARLGETVVLGHRTIRPGCSLGVTFFPADGNTPKDLLKNADIALYQAKARGRGVWEFYDPVLKRRVESRQATTDALREALAGNRIGMAVQTQVDFQTRRHIGFEVLARWEHKGRTISPGEFIPVAEETGLIIPLGQAMLEQALSMARDIRGSGFDPGRIAVNVAASQLKQPDFTKTVASMLDRYGIQSGMLEVEVTENVLLDRASSQIELSLKELHQLGVKIALDDFGTGHASLSHLKRFPVDRIKIDQSFVREIQSASEDSIIVRAIINLAHNLGMEVVAEGIETEEQFALLREQGCDVAQGYLLGMPVPPSQAISFCASDPLSTSQATTLRDTPAAGLKRAASG
ncbi:MAG: EAL domain-containing protein [Hoeflea sp.]|uniref:sensor domain-containing protein n=1 Tax=Hoeflea sp. TaxID=1940281 RepID=UPI001D75DB47|nr:EAL domain-containing protein [Hoeflea sp.]MBU4528838.1 EAL domain-containing protein [Alphaproteobacteria bacterium]MBU4545835.1 EAL domain-containing protein [Alphaproteobacteria bacterium]MBU4549972.1 EAL domain-containing protein [Alphaproteobacteria bacterium]MBV1725969.1 EAL domain-containing protein [Hoeflea sp.]MBV1762694.1 EAL domain-containing protein [Hoeflea sp.]